MCGGRIGTLIITRGHPEGGTQKTAQLCTEHKKPRFIVNLQYPLKVAEFAEWVRTNNIRTLNVAGPRESKQSGIAKQAEKALAELFASFTQASA